MPYNMPSPEFIRQLKEFEGFYSTPYLCPAGKASIGYGANLEAHPQFIPWTDVQAAVAHGDVRGRALVRELAARGMVWDASRAEGALLQEVHALLEELQRRCVAFAELLARDEYVRAEALLDMAYNMGVGRAPGGNDQGCGLLMFYSFLPRMQRGEWEAAAEGLKSTRWHGQVGRRARAICTQIRTGEYGHV